MPTAYDDYNDDRKYDAPHFWLLHAPCLLLHQETHGPAQKRWDSSDG